MGASPQLPDCGCSAEYPLSQAPASLASSPWETVLLNREPEPTLISPRSCVCRSTLSEQQEKEFGQAGVKLQARTMVPTASRDGSDSTELWFAAHSGEGASDAVAFPLQKEGEEHPHFPSS